MKKVKLHSLFLIVFAVMLSFNGCAGSQSNSGYTKEGKEYGKVRGAFRHRWWNYYERAISFGDGEFYQEAIEDLKVAIRLREKDQRMARTYGMHFIDYFPHRELGVVLYRMGNVEDAKKELELSLSEFPSAKAQFYLDQVRKERIVREGKAVTPPRLTLDLKDSDIWTNEDSVSISGVAEDEQYISAISINGIPLYMESSQKQVSFKENLRLSQGEHTIEVVAVNLPGQVTKQKVNIHVDREGPMVTLEDLALETQGQDRVITISGWVYDDAGVSALKIEDRSISVQKETEFFFKERFVSDKDTLVLEVRDRLGNLTSAGIPLSRTSASRSPLMLACADSGDLGFLLAGLFGTKDDRPPIINLKGWTDTQTVFLEKIYLEGEIRDEGKVVKLSVNQVPILRRAGQSIFINHILDLSEGENTLLIEAVDEAGNTAEKKISVIRKVPKALQLAERLSMAVIPFEQKGEVSEVSTSFQDTLIDALVNQNRFRVVERDKLDVILQEQNLSRTNLVDRSTALKLGRLTAAKSIITGSIIQTRSGIEIVTRLIDTETSEIMATEDVYDEIQDLRALKSLAEGIAVKLHRDFPLLDGLIVQQKGKYIFTDLGKDKINIQSRLIVFREEPIKHPVTGKILGADNVIMGHARITQVMPELSKAEMLDGDVGSLKPMDRVITE